MSLLSSSLLYCSLLGLLCGILGNFLIARKMSLIGDMLGHAILPGICLGFILSSFEKNLLSIFACSLFVALIANYLHEFFSSQEKIKSDASLAIILSGFYGLGVLMISWINQKSVGSQSGLEKYLLGQASTISHLEGLFIFFLLIISLLYIFFSFKELRSICFDPQYCQSSWGAKVNLHLFFLSTLISASVIASLQSVGIVLSCAYMIIPASCGLFLSQRFSQRIFIGAAVGALSSVLGVLFSFYFTDVPTGPSIILFASLFFSLCALLGPEGGVLLQKIKKRKKKEKDVIEDLLKSIYYFQESSQSRTGVSLSSIMTRIDNDHESQINFAIKHSLTQKLITVSKDHNNLYQLTEKGYGLAAEIVRKHRIWELYLVSKLGFNPQTVHDNAEHAEHFLTPEITNAIEKIISTKNIDPHGKKIPSIADLKKHGVPGY